MTPCFTFVLHTRAYATPDLFQGVAEVNQSSTFGRPVSDFLLDYKQVVLLLSLLRNNPQIIKLKAKAIETASLAQVLELLATFETEGVPPGRYVYAFISESGKIKIGITTDVDRRFKELSAMSPERLTLAFYKPATSKGYADEVRLHKACAEYRLHNEWFAPEALSLVQSQLDPNPKC